MNALHWATNHGQLETVRMLLKLNPPLEKLNSYGATVLGTAVRSAMNEPKPHHLEIIGELLTAGALVTNLRYPTGSEGIDELLRRHGASKS